MCINFKKNIWLWTAVNQVTKRLFGFFVGDRSSESFEKLCEKISHIDTKFYATDKFPAYDIIPPDKHLIVKSNTFTVERMNRLLRHYLARFARKTYCWSRSLSMISFSVSLFAFFYQSFYIFWQYHQSDGIAKNGQKRQMYDTKIREQNFQSYINFWTNNKFYEQNEQDNGEEDDS